MKIKPVILAIVILTNIASAQSVKIIEKDGNWQLLVGSDPFYVKGVVGDSWLNKVKAYGGNSIRTEWNKDRFDEASRLGLYALVNLPAGAERDGMDYEDAIKVKMQTDRIIQIVKRAKDHPAVLMWAIGNELDFIPQNRPYNLKVWDAVEQAARAIKKIDTNHPVMTVIGTSRMEKVAEIIKRCPDIDLLGINTYGDIYKLPKTLKKYGWTKPFVITEWGPDGYWEVKKTPWGAPYEQTGREKFASYENKYLQAIAPQKGYCLGSYVFYWSGSKQETTHTWFCMFDAQGNETPLPELMRRLWTGREQSINAPIVESLDIGGFTHGNAIYLEAGSQNSATAEASDNGNAELTYRWEIRPEAKYSSYAGQGENEPMPLTGLVNGQTRTARFTAPAQPGAYRLFVYAIDGSGHFSSANLPFYVGNK